MTKLQQLRGDLRKFADPVKKVGLQCFFKTGPGQYGEGDVFLGVMVPQTRSVAVKYKDLPLADIKKLLASPVHEERLTALLVLVHNFAVGDAKQRKELYRFYLGHTKHINNWDLVDLSADKIVGRYLLDNPKEKTILAKLVKSKNIWERRIAVLATFQFIKSNQFGEALEVAEKLLGDKHDLIHKAVGWMLREVGKKNKKAELEFLNKHASRMPRVMLRYAIEKFPKPEQQKFLQIK